MYAAFLKHFGKEDCESSKLENGIVAIPQNTTLYLTMDGYINSDLSSEFKNGCSLNSFEPTIHVDSKSHKSKFVCAFRLLTPINARIKKESNDNETEINMASLRILNDASVDVFIPHHSLNQLKLVMYYKI